MSSRTASAPVPIGPGQGDGTNARVIPLIRATPDEGFMLSRRVAFTVDSRLLLPLASSSASNGSRFWGATVGLGFAVIAQRWGSAGDYTSSTPPSCRPKGARGYTVAELLGRLCRR